DYFTTDFTAISPGDYTAVPLTTETITAGNLSTPITITLVDDGVAENDETFTITLTNQPADINIGPDNPVSFTIHDDDNLRKIYYSVAASSGSEGTTPVQITVQITPSEFGPNPTTVDYQVTGGTANGGGEDFTLASGTLLIPPFTISNTFDITINDDSYDEPDETIIISLSNPTNSSLSEVNPVVHTFTIQDNDNPPQVQFSSATSNGNESTVSVNVPVEISALSQSDVVVDYTVTGTATSGPDHNLIDGSVTIPAGSLSATINFTVSDDSEMESHETVIITMTDPPLNAVLGTQTDHTYTILDNDTQLGYSGPGGVGDFIFNILWLEADSITGLADGEDVTNWFDGSGNGSDLSADASYSPVYQSGIVNGKPVVRFNKANNRIRRTGFNNFPTSEITTFIVDNTNDISDGLFSYASTSTDNDFLLFNSSNIGIYREMTDNSGVSINDGNWHILDVSWRSSDGADAVWLDGSQEFTSFLNAGTFITQNGCLAIGGEQDAVDGGYSAGQAHNGDIAEIIVYNIVLNQAQRIIVANYLAAKYNIDISASGNDFFIYEVTHSNDVAGIGRVDVNNLHQAAESGRILKADNAAGLGNGEYLLFGHDDASIVSWTNTDVPVDSLKRIAREWRFTETGDVGALTLTVDTNKFSALPDGHEGYYLLVDADGTFATGASVYPMTLSGDVYEASSIDINDGDFVTVAIKGVTAKFTITASATGEASGTANIEVKLSNTLSTDVTVNFAIVGGTATQGAGNDYTIAASPITISAGFLTANIVVTINDDAEIEVEETVLIDLT
ncbi:MAG: hypothetical protein KAT38_10705, partial [Bacteroidales bacterium]|nr:hypothetical protein [Bacteroidales bacterium]